MGDTTLQRLRRILSRRTKQSLDDPTLTPAAVLLLLYLKDGEYHVLFNRRSQAVGNHKGEVSFPGGTKDQQDPDLLATALRETWEEMGIHPEDVTILGELDEVATRTHFAIHTFVGTLAYPYPFRVSEAEVEEVIEIPLAALRDVRNRREEARLLDSGQLARRYSYAYNQHLIYGATATILTQLLELVESSSNKEALQP